MKLQQNKNCLGCRAVKGTSDCSLGYKTTVESIEYHGRVVNYGKPAEPCTKVRHWHELKNLKKGGA